jgi:flagellar biosynthesis component FlhA
VGQNLIPIFDPDQGGLILDGIHQIRQQILQEEDFKVPPVRIMDDESKEVREYVLLIGEEEVFRGKVHSDFVVLNSLGVPLEAKLVESSELGYEVPVIWISHEYIDILRKSECTILVTSQ